MEEKTVVMPQRQALGALTESAVQREIAEVQGAMVIAKRFPRDEKIALDRILNTCQRPGLAETALYTYSRGGTEITGPSIRLAEAIAQNWGNIQFGIKEIEQRNGESTVESFAWDIETNTRQIKTFQVPHKRYTRKGTYNLEDPRDIYENVANQGARRLRACILGIVPGDIVEQAVEQCEATLKAKADCSKEAISKMLSAFEQFGVTKEQIEKRIQRRLDSISPAQKVALGKIYNSIKDGMSAPIDWFEIANVQENVSGQKETGIEKAKRAYTKRKTETGNPGNDVDPSLASEPGKRAVPTSTHQEAGLPEIEGDEKWALCNGEQGPCISLLGCQKIGKTATMIEHCKAYTTTEKF